MELTKRSMDEMIANFNREVSCMDLSAADKIKILGMITAIGFRYKEDVQFVHAIPTAQPEPSWDCEKCMMEHTDEMEKLEAELAMAKSKHPEPCEDAVNRETILKFFDGWMSVLDENCHNQSVSDLKIIKRDFANLPSVTPKQRTGKWIYCEDSMADCVDGYRCDKCGFFVPWDYTHKSIDYIKDYNYCPNCGAKMEVTDGDD